MLIYVLVDFFGAVSKDYGHDEAAPQVEEGQPRRSPGEREGS